MSFDTSSLVHALPGVDTDGWTEVVHAHTEPENIQKTGSEYLFYARTAAAAFAQVAKDSSPIFVVDISPDDLWAAWIDNLEPSLKQRFTCSACRRLIKKYGGLAQIDKSGRATSLLWRPADEGVPEWLRTSITALHDKVASSSVHRVFKVTPKTLSVGTQASGGYQHLFLKFPKERLHKQELNGFASATANTLVAMLRRVIDDYSLDTVRQVATIITEDKLPYTDNHKAAIKWLLNLRETQAEDGTETTAYVNLLYLNAAASFQGCLNQLRNGALSTLLKDVEAGRDFEQIKSSWMKICDPISYLRPQAAPTLGQINAAEKVMESLGVTNNDMRRRRYALGEVPPHVILWATKQKAVTANPKPGGVFSGLIPRSPTTKTRSLANPLNAPPTAISFSKFVTDVLPKAGKIEYRLDRSNSLYFFLTGFEGTKPLMKWHDETNLVSWFVYHRPHPVEDHNLLARDWNEVACIVPFPHLWSGTPQTTTFPLAAADSTDFKYYHKSLGFRYLICLKNAKLKSHKSLSLFPQCLKSEYHGIRKTIEAYSNNNHLEDLPQLEEKGEILAGIEVDRSNRECDHLLRVTDGKGSVSAYRIKLFE